MRHRETDSRIPAIIGLGKSTGSRRITNADIDEFLGTRQGATDRLMQRGGIGIQNRFWVERGTQATSDLVVEALKEAFDNAKVDKKDLKALWIATSSPDFLGGSVAAIVQKKMGLPNSMLGSTNSDACPGWILAYYKAVTNLTSPYGTGGPQAVVGAEVISNNLSKKKGVVSALFGDGAGAIIVDNVLPDRDARTNMGFAFGLDGEFAEHLGVKAGGSRLPTSAETVENDQHSVHMEGEIIFHQAVRRMSEMIKQAAQEANTKLSELNLLIPHQANRRIIEATAEKLGIPIDHVMITIYEYGNTSAASIPITVYEAWKQGKLKRNDTVGVASFGSGLVFDAAVIPMVGLP